MIIIIILIVLILFILFKLKIKKMVYGHLNLFTGDLKVGKSALSLSRAIKQYKSEVFKWKIKCFLKKLFHHKDYLLWLAEKPLFYSNIPVKFDYVPLTLELLQRKKRFRYKSVCWFDEASLFADSMSSIRCNGMSKNELDEFNKTLNNFIKLYCHETHNGYLYYNTQALTDMHYAFKRVTNRYYYLHSCIKWLPFIVVYRVSELYHSEDNSSINVNLNGDVLENTKLVFMSKKIWKKYDRFAYSKFTDDLPCEDTIIHGAYLKDLKAQYILSVIDLPNINTTFSYDVQYDFKKKKKRFSLVHYMIQKKKAKKGVKKNDKKEIK